MGWTGRSPAPRRIIPTPTPTEFGITWNEAQFKEYIKDPKAKIPGTKMAFAGIKNEKESMTSGRSCRIRQGRKDQVPPCDAASLLVAFVSELPWLDGIVVRQEGVSITSGPAALAIRATVSVMAGAPEV